MRIARVALGFVGAVAIVLALCGFAYNFSTIRVDYSNAFGHDIDPYFYHAFYTMSAICLACYTLLLYIGVQMIRGKTDVTRLLVLLIAFEVLYFFAIGSLWLLPDYGMSIGGATGVANGGLMIQVFSLFPLWAPPVAFIASRILKDESAAQNERGIAVNA